MIGQLGVEGVNTLTIVIVGLLHFIIFDCLWFGSLPFISPLVRTLCCSLFCFCGLIHIELIDRTSGISFYFTVLFLPLLWCTPNSFVFNSPVTSSSLPNLILLIPCRQAQGDLNVWGKKRLMKKEKKDKRIKLRGTLEPVWFSTPVR